jgi:hypothetical protein
MTPGAPELKATVPEDKALSAFAVNSGCCDCHPGFAFSFLADMAA